MSKKPSTRKDKTAGGGSQPPDIEALLAALRKLEASGPHGFEGLVRDLLARLTGMRYRLLKSGPQGGADAVSDPDATGLLIAMEGKRYGQKTKLPLDQLKAKLHDAIDTHQDLDIWLLATTREIDAGDAEKLRTTGRSSGVAVEILDSPATPGALPELACLCAMFPDVTLVHLGVSADCAAHLQSIAAAPEFLEQSARLRQRFANPELGYANARTAAHRWLRQAMSDVATAKAYLGGYLDVLAPDAMRIRRPGLDRELTEWWNTHRAHMLALLGEEGMGKTWESVSWWLDRVDDAPLTLFIAAGEVGHKEPAVAMAHALLRCTGLRDAAYWERRVRTWLRNAHSDHPGILLLVDGLNQHPLFREWPEFLQRLSAAPYAGKVAAIVTDRPDDWMHRLDSLAGLTPPPRTITVPPFTDEELREPLAENGLTPGDFDPSLAALMRVLRLCQLAIRLRRELLDSSDITRERLVLEEWKDRLSRRSQTVRLSDVEFREWVADIGRPSRRELESGSCHIDHPSRVAGATVLGERSLADGPDERHQRDRQRPLARTSWGQSLPRPARPGASGAGSGALRTIDAGRRDSTGRGNCRIHRRPPRPGHRHRDPARRGDRGLHRNGCSIGYQEWIDERVALRGQFRLRGLRSVLALDTAGSRNDLRCGRRVLDECRRRPLPRRGPDQGAGQCLEMARCGFDARGAVREVAGILLVGSSGDGVAVGGVQRRQGPASTHP